ncbi:hypothetical protein AAHA92_22597 [Salvia divinorum]|uniref:Uncharacterized protein n=1 Tax=Salvia divinorum TaxID=28513 RepID=A0ABD1GP74_SALDI
MGDATRPGRVCNVGCTSEGVGFNVHGDYKIDIDDEQWEHVVQVDKDAKFMRNKPWPFWETWKCIFGRDRATGGGVEDIPVATARVRSQVAGGSQCGESAYHPSFEKFIIDDSNNVPQEPATQNNSSDNSVKYTSTTKTGSLKRKNETNDADLMHFLSNLHADTNNRLEVIAARIGYEFDLGKARQEVFEKLGEVNGLTLDQRYELCDILGDKSQRLEVFMGMPSHARLGYVMRLIHQNQKAD